MRFENSRDLRKSETWSCPSWRALFRGAPNPIQQVIRYELEGRLASDRVIAFKDKRELPGWGPWSAKKGGHHVSPPSEVMVQMLAVRIHLDDCGDVRRRSRRYSLDAIADPARLIGSYEAEESARHPPRILGTRTADGDEVVWARV